MCFDLYTFIEFSCHIIFSGLSILTNGYIFHHQLTSQYRRKLTHVCMCMDLLCVCACVYIMHVYELMYVCNMCMYICVCGWMCVYNIYEIGVALPDQSSSDTTHGCVFMNALRVRMCICACTTFLFVCVMISCHTQRSLIQSSLICTLCTYANLC